MKYDYKTGFLTFFVGLSNAFQKLTSSGCYDLYERIVILRIHGAMDRLRIVTLGRIEKRQHSFLHPAAQLGFQ